VGEFAEALLGGQRLVPKALLDAGFKFRFDTCEAALADLLPKA
jgi:NAD dependent epimerase/dehydratase family enzyme